MRVCVCKASRIQLSCQLTHLFVKNAIEESDGGSALRILEPAVSFLTLPLLLLLPSLFTVAAEGEDAVRAKLRAVNEELVERFRTLEEEFR